MTGEKTFYESIIIGMSKIPLVGDGMMDEWNNERVKAYEVGMSKIPHVRDGMPIQKNLKLILMKLVAYLMHT